MQTAFPAARSLPGTVRAHIFTPLNATAVRSAGTIAKRPHPVAQKRQKFGDSRWQIFLVLCVFQAAACMAATVSPASLSWAAVPVGGKGAQKAVTLTNSGTTAITISSIAISGTNPGDFQIFSKTCGTSLAASASCTANIIFGPTVAGARSATLKFTDTGTGSPQSVALTGNGTGTTGSVTAAPAGVSFTNTAVRSTSSPQAVTLSNGSKAAITVSSIAISGANAAAFAISSKTCGGTLAASASCTTSIVFKPTASGNFTATLGFTDTGTNSPQKTTLSGSTTASSSAFTIAPMSPTVVVNEALQFSATTSVSWSASCGTIASTSGLYSAPSTTGSCTVTATEISGTHPTVSTSVRVTASPSSGTLGVYPSTAAVFAGSRQIFQAQLSTVPDGHSLSYSIDGVAGGNGAVGTVTNEGVYTAPGAAGTHHLTVRDNSLGTTATSTITVFSQVAVDFASRSTALHAVPPHFFGAERMNSMHNTADLDFIKAGGITYARFYAGIPQVFPTSSTPKWSAIDGVIRNISAGGTKIILQIYQTPVWLQPSPNPCGSGNFNAEPKDLHAWGLLAAQYVKHMDQTFPGVVTDYEIWNEPNTTAFCVPAASRLTEYKKLYIAAVPAMRAQAKADGSTARVGGPATAGMQSAWVSAMLSDPTISQNIDFLAYHDYMFNNLQLGAQWDTYNGTMSVYQKTQNTGNGPLDVYLYATRLVAGGKQPQGKNLPIYNTEYNLDWDFAKNCCSNDFTYSPVWNGMYVADLLNAVYAGAPNTPGHMVYFAATAHPYFCLVGQINANMDCTYPAGSVPQPYPQYFLYQLLGANNYLGLQAGGHMASSISPGIKGNGLVVTAFYTANLDAVVLINPTADTFSNVPVSIANTGLTAPAGTLYEIVDGRSIQTSSVSLQSQGGTSYSTAVTVGPYSVQAISIHH